jgi:hypothetical protein
MNIHEAAALMARIVDTWPAGRWPNGTSSEWTKDLCELDKTIAERARLALKRTQTTQPTWAAFVAEYRAATPRPDWQPPLDDDPVVTPDRGLEHVAAVRAELAARGHKT